MGLLAISLKDPDRSAAEVCRSLCADLAGANGGPTPGLRTATCSALDHVEPARVDRSVFLELLQRFRRSLAMLSGWLSTG